MAGIEVEPELVFNETILAWASTPARDLSKNMIGDLGGLTLYELADTLVSAPLSTASLAVNNCDIRRAWAIKVSSYESETKLPWTAIVSNYSLGTGFIRQAAKRVYEVSELITLGFLVRAYVDEAHWKGSQIMTAHQRFDALSQALPRLIFPENIGQAGFWLPEDLIAQE